MGEINILDSAFNEQITKHNGKKAPWIGITGTNGKSTVVYLTNAILTVAGYKVRIAQTEEQIWEATKDSEADFVLIEVSAKMLENMEQTAFDTSAILNIAGDYKTGLETEEYANLKAKIYQNTKRSCIFNADDRTTDLLVQDADVQEGARAIGFTHHQPSRSQIGYLEGMVIDRAFYDDDSDPLRYLHATELVNLLEYTNLLSPIGKVATFFVEDIVAAIAIARTYGVSADVIKEALRNFEIPAHQNQLIYRRKLNLERKYGIGEILYIDDTASNNIAATEATLKSYPADSVLWIGAGFEHSVDYSLFAAKIANHLYSAFIIGDESSELYQAMREHAPSVPTYLIAPLPFDDAISRALALIEEKGFENHNVVLSPAGKSDLIGGQSGISKAYCETLAQKARDIQEYALKVGLA